jgi:hypothetical protein
MAYECILLKTARKFLDERVTPEERKHIVEILEKIRDDPLVDGIKKFYFLAAPAVFTIYKEAEWWIIYYSPRENVLHIINIGRVNELVNIRRSS